MRTECGRRAIQASGRPRGPNFLAPEHPQNTAQLSMQYQGASQSRHSRAALRNPAASMQQEAHEVPTAFPRNMARCVTVPKYGRATVDRSTVGRAEGRRSVDGPSTVRRRSVHGRAVDEGRSVGPRTVDVLSTVGTQSVDDRSVRRSMVGPRSVGSRSTVGPRSVHGRSPISQSVDGRCTVSRRSADGRPWFSPRSDVGVGVGVAGS